MDEQVVDKILLVSQCSIDSRPTSVDLRDANAPPENEVENEEEPCFWSQINLRDTDLEFNADEETSSRENVKRHFDKIELMNNSTK